MEAHRQASASVMQLQGAAKDFARSSINMLELQQGGIVNGQQVDGVTYLIAALQARWGQLEEENRLTAMTEYMAFTRHPNESINNLLTRFEVVRQRAEN